MPGQSQASLGTGSGSQGQWVFGREDQSRRQTCVCQESGLSTLTPPSLPAPHLSSSIAEPHARPLRLHVSWFGVLGTSGHGVCLVTWAKANLAKNAALRARGQHTVPEGKAALPRPGCSPGQAAPQARPS